jgi:hypothetical protein
MRSGVLVLGLALVATCAERKENNEQYQLTVYVRGSERVPFPTLKFGEMIASRIYSSIGVVLTWVHENSRNGQAMVVQFAQESRRDNPSEALGYALPYEGSRIIIYYSRMEWAQRDPNFAPKLLGYVLAHEIAHNLQAIARHSDTGLMKAHWAAADYSDMRCLRLRFEPLDVELIHWGLKRRARLSVPQQLAQNEGANSGGLTNEEGQTRKRPK